MSWNLPTVLTLADLRSVVHEHKKVVIPDAAIEAVRASAATVKRVVAKGEPVYGINTGFGKLARVRIPDDSLHELQLNLVRSHAVGVGPLIDPAVVRTILLLKIASLAKGFSGITEITLQALVNLYNHDILPCIPSQGSVGASGDLAPLAHLSLPLIGEGEVMVDGKIMPALEALKAKGLAPIQLQPKEGLALLNGTQVSTGIALSGLFRAEQVFAAAVVAGSLSVDASKGSDSPFDDRIHAVRGHSCQSRVAGFYRCMLEGSEIRQSHLVDDDRVQDPYSLRCQPQVMGACLEIIENAAKTLITESNAVSDNPLVFSDSDEILSGGNFHAEPVAFAADTLALAMAEVGALSERRIALLIDGSLSGLPPFLVQNSGLNSGFMIAHVTAAALASENKTLAHPASVDSLPTSANQEDHVSMATFAARKLADIALNVRHIIAIELMAAVQGIDFHRPLQTSAVLEKVHATIRSRVAHFDRDRAFSVDIAAVEDLIESDTFTHLVQDLLPSHSEAPIHA